MRFFKSFLSFFPPLLFGIMVAIPWVMARVLTSYVHASIGNSGNYPFLGDSLPALLLMTMAFCFSSRALALGAVLLGFLTVTLKTTALLLYQQALMPLNFRSVKLIWEHTDHAGLTAYLGTHYLWWSIPLLLGVAVLVTLCCLAVWNTPWKKMPFRRCWGVCFSVLLILSIAANVAHIVDSFSDPQIIYNGHLVTPLPALVAGEIYDVCRMDKVKNKTVSAESQKFLTELNVLPSPTPHVLNARFDKIIIIAMESIDLDFIGGCNPRMPQGITPELDHLIAEYPNLLHYYTAAQPTTWGLSALLLSRLDFDRDRKIKGLPSLFTEAAKQGYRSYYFAPVSGLFGDNSKLYQDLFGTQDQYFLEDFQREFPVVPKYQWGISDPELYDCVLKVLRRDKPEKFIALVSTMDTHPDYTAVGKAADDPRFQNEPFLNALHAADFNLGEFLRTVMADKTLYDERTLLIVTADHTATHGRNYLNRASYLPERIPLIFISQQSALFRSIPPEQYCSSIDLAPTLLALTGTDVPPDFMGKSLFEGKNAAVSHTLDDDLLLRSDKGLSVVSLPQEAPKKQPERAFYEWFHAAY